MIAGDPASSSRAAGIGAEARVDRALAETSVVVALKDDVRVLDCIASIDERVEIVLALNGTPPELRRLLATHPRTPVLAEIPETGNLGAAYNAGIEAASGRYILLMDSDCRFATGTVRTMARLVTEYPVVKGQVVYGVSPGLLSTLIARIREFDEGDYVSALSPPLIYDRTIAEHIGGYHFDPLIHWCEDREFDFRLQLADIPVLYEASAVIFHDAQRGAQDLRSYWRYGKGEAIGQELGLFTTPALPVIWRLVSDLLIVIECARAKGAWAGAYYVATLGAFHAGTAWHLLVDPYRVRSRYPPTARRVRMLRSIPQHCTALTDEQKRVLRAHHARAGRYINPCAEFRPLLEDVRATQQAAADLTRASEGIPTAT
jgi:GT2 family glycosyltransferase